MFVSLLVILVIASIVASYYLLREEKLHNKMDLEQMIRISQLKNELSDKDKEIERLNKELLDLENQLLQGQEVLKNENANKLNLEKELAELKGRIEKLNKDLSSEQTLRQQLKEKYELFLKTINSTKFEEKEDISQ